MLLAQWIRVLFNDNGTLIDYSIASQDPGTTIFLPFVNGEDYLYVGQSFPFNNLLLEVSTANDQSASISVDYWNGQAWQPAVDVLDATVTGGVALAKSAVVQFTPDRDSAWTNVTDTSDFTPTGLSGTEIYHMNWLRLSWSADLNAATALSSVSYAFTSDDIIDALDPELDQFLTSWESGKTSWLEQIKVGSQMMVHDLRSRGIITNNGQIIQFDQFALPCAFRTMMNIYGILGTNYQDRLNWAKESYAKLLNQKNFLVDVDRDGRKSRGEDFGGPIKGIR